MWMYFSVSSFSAWLYCVANVSIGHRFDENTPIEETVKSNKYPRSRHHNYWTRVAFTKKMQALHDVVQAGYTRYIGMSSCYAWQCKSLLLPSVILQTSEHAKPQSKQCRVINFPELFHPAVTDYVGQTMPSTTASRLSSRCRTTTIWCTVKKSARWCLLWRLVSYLPPHSFLLMILSSSMAVLWGRFHSVVPTCSRSVVPSSGRDDEAWWSRSVSLPYDIHLNKS